jgi:hypothetical protein
MVVRANVTPGGVISRRSFQSFLEPAAAIDDEQPVARWV